VDLGGRWKAIEADEDARRHYPEPAFDDTGWADLDVPGHWRDSPAFAASDGPLLARHRFETSRPAEAGRRTWLTFDGVFYQADVWLDGSYLGDTEGYFFPHTFEVTDDVAERNDHVLAVEVACAQRSLTGLYQTPEHNPGGIWQPVRLHETGPVRIARLRVLCPEATPERAVLTFRAVLDAAEATTIALRTTVGEASDNVEEHALAAGENRVEWRVGIENPPLWWPHALGDPRLIDVTVEAGDSDRRTIRTGIRQVRMRDWIGTVNGERLFLKGVDARPDDDDPIAEAKAAGLDLVRVRGHVAAPRLYERADDLGVLLWQDLPLHGGYPRNVRKQATRQAREAVDALGHHPSIALWCAHSSPYDAGPLAALLVPTYNKTVLDASVARALEKADKSRPVVAHADPAPAKDADMAKAIATWPRLGRFVTDVDPKDVDTLRRLKYRPAGGFVATTRPHCEQVTAVADPATGDVHVVSDLREPIKDAIVTAGGQRWQGDVPADAVVKVGTVDPDNLPEVRIAHR
jgi:beta-mannosidase